MKRRSGRRRNRTNSITSTSSDISSAGDSVGSEEAERIVNNSLIAVTSTSANSADGSASSGGVNVSRRSSARINSDIHIKRSNNSSNNYIATETAVTESNKKKINSNKRSGSGISGNRTIGSGEANANQSATVSTTVNYDNYNNLHQPSLNNVKSWLKSSAGDSNVTPVASPSRLPGAAGQYFSLPDMDMFYRMGASTSSPAFNTPNNSHYPHQLQRTYSEVLARDYDFDFSPADQNAGEVSSRMFAGSSSFSYGTAGDYHQHQNRGMEMLPLHSISPLAINPSLVRQDPIDITSAPVSSSSSSSSISSSSSYTSQRNTRKSKRKSRSSGSTAIDETIDPKPYRRGEWMSNPHLREKHACLSCPFCKRMFKNRNGLRYHVKNAVCEQAKAYVRAVQAFSRDHLRLPQGHQDQGQGHDVVNVNIFHQSNTTTNNEN